MRTLGALIIGGFAIACAATDTPAVAACHVVGADGPGPSEGLLTVLPSQVPGIEITDAAWRVRTGRDVTPIEVLYLSATLHADRRIAHDEIAVVYDAPGPHAVVDATLFDEGGISFDLSRTRPFLEQNQIKRVSLFKQLRSAYWMGRRSSLGYCPRTARVVPRSTLALVLAPDLRTPAGQAARLRVRASDSSSLVVIMDTSFIAGPASNLVAGAALNRTDSTLTDMVIGLVVVKTENSVRLVNVDTTRSADTLEYRVGTIPPHQLVLFAGGRLGLERIAKRVAYHPKEVAERDIAGVEQMHRASSAAREGRARTTRRSQCAAGTATCAE